MKFAQRMDRLGTETAFEVMARAKALEAQGKHICPCQIGEPDFVTPDPILEAGKQAFNDGHTHYTPALGLPQLREAIVHYYEQHYQLTIASQRIVITPGASGALLLVLGVLINPGEQVLMADPGYPCNRNFVRFMEGEAIGIPVDASTNYQLSKELIEQHWTQKTRASYWPHPLIRPVRW